MLNTYKLWFYVFFVIIFKKTTVKLSDCVCTHFYCRMYIALSRVIYCMSVLNGGKRVWNANWIPSIFTSVKKQYIYYRPHIRCANFPDFPRYIVGLVGMGEEMVGRLQASCLIARTALGPVASRRSHALTSPGKIVGKTRAGKTCAAKRRKKSRPVEQF